MDSYRRSDEQDLKMERAGVSINDDIDLCGCGARKLASDRVCQDCLDIEEDEFLAGLEEEEDDADYWRDSRRDMAGDPELQAIAEDQEARAHQADLEGERLSLTEEG